MKAAINGLGRIGRMVLRRAVKGAPGNLDIAAVNDLTPVDELAYLLRFDSVHGRDLRHPEYPGRRRSRRQGAHLV